MQIRRPLCLASLIFVLLVMCCVYGGERQEDALPEEGERITLTGIVKNKEYRVMYGAEVPVLYVSSAEDKNDRQVMCCMTGWQGGGTLPCMGDAVRVSGKVSLFREAGNPGEFDSGEYYQILNISYKLNQTEILECSGSGFTLQERLFQFRCDCSEILENIYPPKEASVLKAMLLGEKSSLDEEIKELYQLNGLIHILSISGLHISLLGMAVSGLLKKCGARIWLRAPAAIGIMWCYGLMTGMGVSTWRAVFMFALHLLAELFGRTYDMLTALSLAAVLMLAEQPLFVMHSGFLLSFGAVLGIGAVLPWWKEMFRQLAGRRAADRGEEIKRRDAGKKGKKKEPVGIGRIMEKQSWGSAGKRLCGLMAEGLCLSTAIAAAALPVLLCFYYTYPVYSLLLNLYVIPLMSLVLAFGMLSLALGFILPGAAFFPGLPGRSILWLYEVSCRGALRLPGGIRIGGRPEPWQIMIYYIVLAGLVLWHNLTEEENCKRGWSGGKIKGKEAIHKKYRRMKWKREGYDAGNKVRFPGIPAICQWLLVLGVCWLLLVRPFSGFKVSFLDVGQGDCIVMRNGNGNCYMMDGGSTSKSKVGEYQILPFLESEGIGELEAVFVTHPDEDHISGILELMEQSVYGVRIKSLVLPDASEKIKEEKLFVLRERAAEYGIPVFYIGRGDVVQDRKLRFTCLGPEKGIATDEVNEISTVLYAEYGDFRMLLTGDVTGEPEEELLAELEGREPLTVLKVAHHGSKYSTPEELLELTNPVITVISAGKDNRYGHPHEELMDRLREQGCRICQTSEGGAVMMEVKGGRIQVEEYLRRKPWENAEEKG